MRVTTDELVNIYRSRRKAGLVDLLPKLSEKQVKRVIADIEKIINGFEKDIDKEAKEIRKKDGTFIDLKKELARLEGEETLGIEVEYETKRVKRWRLVGGHMKLVTQYVSVPVTKPKKISRKKEIGAIKTAIRDIENEIREENNDVERIKAEMSFYEKMLEEIASVLELMNLEIMVTASVITRGHSVLMTEAMGTVILADWQGDVGVTDGRTGKEIKISAKVKGVVDDLHRQLKDKTEEYFGAGYRRTWIMRESVEYRTTEEDETSTADWQLEVKHGEEDEERIGFGKAVTKKGFMSL